MSALSRSSTASIKWSAKGITSRREIGIEIVREKPGHGIVFQLSGTDGAALKVPARAEFVVNTLRNVTLGKDGVRLCIVEHFLAAACLWGLDDLLVKIDGPEIPLGDGSAKLWTDLFTEAGWEPALKPAFRELSEPITCKKGDRVLMAVPDDTFSVSYLMDYDHPCIGKIWQTWTSEMAVEEIANARTFGSLKEHQMLGLADDVVSMTPDGFTQPLHWPDEPVRHKLLDLVGDLVLAGVNPTSWKARFISIKGGHELDVQIAKRLSAFVSDKK